MTQHRLQLTEQEPGKAGAYRLLLDDTDMTDSIAEATLTIRGGEPPRLLLDLIAGGLDPVDVAEVGVALTDRSRVVLEALGWTPPAESDTRPEASDA